MTDRYHESRLPADERRDILWKTLWQDYFATRVPSHGCVLDLGSGYGQFINNVTAQRRIAIDTWEEFPDHIVPGVETIVGNVTDLSMIEDHSVDYAFASNLFEHLTREELTQVLAALRAKLSADGTLTILQPNYRYAYKEYFDDYTHLSVYSHISLADFLAANGFETLEVRPRFLPLTVKSHLPVWPILIKMYLRSPIKPLGKQMLITSRPRR